MMYLRVYVNKVLRVLFMVFVSVSVSHTCGFVDGSCEGGWCLCSLWLYVVVI